MNTYSVTWMIGETIEVEANSEEEAIEMVESMSDEQLLEDIDIALSNFEIVNVEQH